MARPGATEVGGENGTGVQPDAAPEAVTDDARVQDCRAPAGATTAPRGASEPARRAVLDLGRWSGIGFPDETDDNAQPFHAGVADSLEAAAVPETAIDPPCREDSPQDVTTATSESADVGDVNGSNPTIATAGFGLPADQIADWFLG